MHDHELLAIPPAPSSTPSTIEVRQVNFTDFPILIAMYISCFAEEPWFEVFAPKDVESYFNHILGTSHSLFFVICEEGMPIGAAMGFPVVAKPEVMTDLPEEDRDSFYVAEIFIDPTRRNRLFSLRVTSELLNASRRHAFTRYSVRTSINQPRILWLFTDHFEAKEVARQDVMSLKRIDGEMCEMSDARVLMSGPIR
jgi:hypothetical protein